MSRKGYELIVLKQDREHMSIKNGNVQRSLNVHKFETFLEQKYILKCFLFKEKINTWGERNGPVVTSRACSSRGL